MRTLGTYAHRVLSSRRLYEIQGHALCEGLQLLGVHAAGPPRAGVAGCARQNERLAIPPHLHPKDGASHDVAHPTRQAGCPAGAGPCFSPEAALTPVTDSCQHRDAALLRGRAAAGWAAGLVALWCGRRSLGL